MLRRGDKRKAPPTPERRFPEEVLNRPPSYHLFRPSARRGLMSPAVARIIKRMRHVTETTIEKRGGFRGRIRRRQRGPSQLLDLLVALEEELRKGAMTLGEQRGGHHE
jgi:hypothetical protein